MVAPSGEGTLPALADALATQGLLLRGGFRFEHDEDTPAGPSGAPARAVLLVGNAGAAYWTGFQAWLAAQPDAVPNPLDTWSRQAIGGVAARFGARAVSPSDRPYLPFQQWAMRAERLKPSPLGLLMHPVYGLWHAYRGALLFEDEGMAAELDAMNQGVEEPIHLCRLCDGKPCLKACPVDAYSAQGFAHEACLAHVRSPSGGPCRSGGCLDRNACPYGVTFRYPPEVQAFHMRAYAL